MQNIDINLLAVFVAAIASMVAGALWYSPMHPMGKKWMALMGISPDHRPEGAGKSYAFSFLSTLVMAYVLAHFVQYVGAITIVDALQVAAWVWLGFIASVQILSVLFEKKPFGLFLINTFYQLASIAVMAIILVLWI